MAHWDWLTGRERLWWRVYRLRLIPGILISLPLWFIMAWYLLFAWANHTGYNKAYGYKQPLTLDLFHLRMHDLFSRDLRRLVLPDADKESALPEVQLFLSNKALDSLDGEGPPEEGKGAYESGLIKKDKQYVKAKFRYRGKKQWHWNYAQKSWKVRMEDDLLVGQQTFSFINPVSPLPFAEEVILNVARHNGLLTPDYFPVRLFLNRAFMGIYYWMGQPDEWMVRRGARVPGAVYSGNGAPEDSQRGVSSLWWDASAWKKPAARTSAEVNDKGELSALLDVLHGVNDAEFARYAREHIDLDKFALFDALDVIFGGNQHDFDQDHKLYLDPYKGRWEPIAWDFRGFEHRRVLSRSENPLQLRLKEIPGYLDMRNRWVWRLLQGECSADAMEESIRGLSAARHGDFQADPYWDAYGQLPEISKYFRQMVRPLTDERYQAYQEALLGTYRKRVQFVKSQLSEAQVSASLSGSQGRRLLVRVEGWDGVDLQRVGVVWDGGEPGGWSVVEDRNGDGVAQATERQWLMGTVSDTMLTPGTMLTPRLEPTPAHGKVRLAVEGRTYGFLLEGRPGSSVRQVTMTLRNRVTDRTFDVVASGAGGGEAVAGGVAGGCADLGVLTEPGRHSPHAWCLPLEPEGDIVLGPGPVEFTQTQVWGERQRVSVRPGTQLRLGPKVSLVFLGQVEMRGTEALPIRVEALGAETFGGVAIQGPASAGSVLEHVQFFGGTHPVRSPTLFGGMLNIQNTKEITVRECLLTGNQGANDALHAAYVTGLVLDGNRFENVESDAADLEFVEASVRGMVVLSAGDECLDLMSSKVLLRDARFLGCGGSGVSAGEESRVRIERSLILGTATGVLAKNHSRVRIETLVVDRAGVGIRIESKQDRYEGLSRVRGRNLWLFRCRTQVRDKEERLKWQSGGSDWQEGLGATLGVLGLRLETPGALFQSLDGLWTGVAPEWREPFARALGALGGSQKESGDE